MHKSNKMMMNVDAVIFDLDGTLLDSMAVYYKIVEIALQKLSLPVVSREVMREAAKDGGFEWNHILPANTNIKKTVVQVS